MKSEHQNLEDRQGGSEAHEAEPEPTEQHSAQAELIAPKGSEDDASGREVENEVLENIQDIERKDDDENGNDAKPSELERAALGTKSKKKKGKKKTKGPPPPPPPPEFAFSYINYMHVAEWSTSESMGVMEVLLDQSDAPAPAPLVNKDGDDEDATAADKNAEQDKNSGVLGPSWSKTKALQLMIQSPGLIANLEGIDRKLNWRAHLTKHVEDTNRVVFIRPFKFLVLREAEIRERFHELDNYRASLPPAPVPPLSDLLPPPGSPPPPPPPLTPPSPLPNSRFSDSPLQAEAHVELADRDSESDPEISNPRNEEALEADLNAQRDEHPTMVESELPPEDVDGGLRLENSEGIRQVSSEHVTNTPNGSDIQILPPGFGAQTERGNSNSRITEFEELPRHEDVIDMQAKEKPTDGMAADAPKPPIKFKDAVGRKFSFPWHLCKTWKGIEELIKQAFLHVDVLGPHVWEGHYDLVGPNGEIILPQVWETLVQPDWAVTMHMWPMPEPPPPPPDAGAMWQRRRNTLDALEHFRLLIRFLDEDLKDIFDMRKQIEEGKLEKIAFDDLWHLFHYGEEVIMHDQDRSSSEKPRAARVLKFTGGRNTKADYKPTYISRTGAGALGPGSWGHAFVVQCWTMIFDGSFFWPEEVVVGIRPYKGERDISSLPIYPSKFDRAGLLADLIEHGKVYRHFTQQAFSHRKYLGRNYESDRGEGIDSEVIIDFREAASTMSSQTYGSEFKSPVGDQIAHDMRELWVEYPEHTLCGQKGWCIRDVIGPDFALDDLELDAFLRDNGHVMHAKETIEDSEVAILPDRVPGYVLNRKIWAMLSTSKTDLMESQATSDPWNDLVLEPKHKVIIEALVAKHLHHPADSTELDTPFQLGDFVAGKGRSIVLLLHGPPGVGKTSTAECIAAHMERPLYPLTSGNLPVRADDLEEHLQVHFNLAARWGCILLLDEADVFLQRRRLNELEINAMVSVFLRQLEYYRGILFLTTNRVGDIDPAFKSRIHVSLEYEPLDRRRTKKIYKLHLRRIKEALELRQSAHGTPFKVKEDEILVWSDQHFKTASKRHRQWNGRQIHNAFQTAVALSEWDARTKLPKSQEQGPHTLPQLVLGKKQFKQVAQVSEGFDQYMTDLMGGRNEADVAAVSAQRYDFRPGKSGEAQSKREVESDSDSDSDDTSGSDTQRKEGMSSEHGSSDSGAKPRKRPKSKNTKNKHESEGIQSSDDGKRNGNKSKGKGSHKTKSNSDSSEEMVKSRSTKDKKKAKSKRRGSLSDSD